MKTLITYSLLNSWLYTFEAPEDYEQDAMDEFMDALFRRPRKENQAIIHGIQFENDCYRSAEGLSPEHKRWRSCADQIGSILKGGQIQARMERDLTVDGNEFLLYGIADCVKAGAVIDVKWMEGSMASQDVTGRWLDSPQHPAYFFLAPDADRFMYLLSDGRDVYHECYYREQSPCITDYIQQFIWYLEKESLIDTYREKWRTEHE